MLKSLSNVLFGTSSKRRLSGYQSRVDQINALGPQLSELTESALLAKTQEFKDRLEKGETVDDICIEAFATVREACRRLKGHKWEVRGKEMEWDMVQYDVQLIGGLALHDGHIAEMATGEGKTLVAVAPLYLNALAGKGAHLVTVNDYLAARDAEWMGGVFRYLGLTVGVIISDMDPASRREAYWCDITYGTNNEFGFDYLRDNMAISKNHLVHRPFHYAILDEVDSVLIDEARTPLIISGQVDRDNSQYERMKPAVEKVFRLQQKLVNDIMAEAKKLLKQQEELDPKSDKMSDLRFQIGAELLKAKKGFPKHKQLQKALQEVDNIRMLEKTERELMLNKNLRELEAELYYVIDEKGHNIDLTDKGREAIAPGNPDQFVLYDIVEEYQQIEARTGLSDEEKAAEKEKVRRVQEEKQETIHTMSQLLRAYSLYERDVEYLIEDDKICIIDENTGRKMAGRRWSDGLHQAVEAKEGVKVEAETQTLATVTLQNYFRMYDKLAGMTGTAETEAQEFSHTYGMDVIVIPTNRPITRDDQSDVVFQTQKQKYTAIVDEVEELHKKGLPVLVGTRTVDVSELISRMLKRKKISHNVLNAKYHERESEIVAEAGQKGAVTIATNMAGRGTDIKLGAGVVKDGEGGLQIVGTERHDSRRIDRQLRGRAGRQGDPGKSQFFVSLEDDLMRLFGSDRISGLMKTMGLEEGEVLTGRMITRAIQSAQKRVENRNFDVRKRTLEYDDVMNKQRTEIYGLRRQVLMCESPSEMRDLLLDQAMGGVETVFSDYGDPDNGKVTDWDIRGFADYLTRYCPLADFSDLEAPDLNLQQAYDKLMEDVEDRLGDAYDEKSEMFGEVLTMELARRVFLHTIDSDWRDHLGGMDELRENVWTSSYAQKEPLVEYQRMSGIMFAQLLDDIAKEIFQHFYLTQVMVAHAENQAPRVVFQKQSAEEVINQMAAREAARSGQAPGGEQGGAPGQQQGNRPAQPRRPQTVVRQMPKVGRNEPCPCGSGKKYKQCHGRVNQLAGSAAKNDES